MRHVSVRVYREARECLVLFYVYLVLPVYGRIPFPRELIKLGTL